MRRLDTPISDLHLMSDADLLRAHCAGDSQAFGRLYDRYDPACFQFVRRTLGRAHAEAAEDVHQETWMAISRNAAVFDEMRASFRAWLFTVARNKVWDHFRRQKAVILASSHEDAALMVADPGPTPVDHLQSREMAERLIAAIDALPLTQRETFVMFAHSGLSLEEVAAVSGVGLETAKSRLRYARTTLRQVLGGETLDHA